MRIPISIKQVAYNCTEQRPCWAYAKLIQKENQITKNTIAELYLLNNDGDGFIFANNFSTLWYLLTRACN